MSEEESIGPATPPNPSVRIRQETLSRIENGWTNPTLGTVRSILRALDQREGAPR